MSWQEFPMATTGVWCSGVVEVQNVAAVLKHRIMADAGSGATPANATRISGASATQAATPSVSSTVDFVSGMGIEAANPNRLIFNVASQTVGNRMGIASVEYDNTGSGFSRVSVQIASSNINGVIRNRLVFEVYDTAGTIVNFTAANIGASKLVRIAFAVAIP